MSLQSFTPSQALTLGVELELQLVSTHDFDLAPQAEDLLRVLKNHTGTWDVKPEITRSMIEIGTSIQRQHAVLLAELHDAHHQPGYWQELVGQMLDMWPNEPDLSAEQLAQIGAPTLLIAGERDNFGSPEQQLFMRRAMPRAQLCILPAASHPVMNQLPQLFQLVALQFLASV